LAGLGETAAEEAKREIVKKIRIAKCEALFMFVFFILRLIQLKSLLQL